MNTNLTHANYSSFFIPSESDCSTMIGSQELEHRLFSRHYPGTMTEVCFLLSRISVIGKILFIVSQIFFSPFVLVMKVLDEPF